MYFTIRTKTSWQKEVHVLRLHDLRDSFMSYPLIEKIFFDDLKELVQKHKHYYLSTGLLQVKDPIGNELDPDMWMLIWAVDKEDRYYQILIERNPAHMVKGAIAAVAPEDFFEFMSGMKEKMIKPFLGMLNTPDKIEKLVVVMSKAKTYTQKKAEEDWMYALSRFERWVDLLKRTPNKEGKWYPGDYPRCPNCNNPIIGITDEKDPTLGHLICPFCGYRTSRRIIPKGKRPATFFDMFKPR